MITGLSTMMEERLKVYQSKSRRLPNRVLVYRDGVSEVSVHHLEPMIH